MDFHLSITGLHSEASHAYVVSEGGAEAASETTPSKFPWIKVLKWWLGTESNRRHEDFQSSALPTELPSHISGTAKTVRAGREPINPDARMATEKFGFSRIFQESSVISKC